MKEIIYILFCMLLLSNCGRKSNDSNVPDHDLLMLTEYENVYEDGRLVKVIITESGSEGNSIMPADRSIFEHRYIYESDRLIRHDEYDVSERDVKELFYSTIYSDNTEEWIGWSGSDTTSYQLREHDPEGRLIRHRVRNNINAPAFDFVVADDYEETYSYDNRVVEQQRREYATGETRTTKFFYDSELSMTSSPDWDIVHYQEEMSGDTLLTKRYFNGSLEDIFKDYGNGNKKYELTFAPDNDLVFSIETITSGIQKIKISKDIEFQWTDSLFYENDMEVKSVLTYPDRKTTTITDYDKHGNVRSISKYIKHHDRPGTIF